MFGKPEVAGTATRRWKAFGGDTAAYWWLPGKNCCSKRHRETRFPNGKISRCSSIPTPEPSRGFKPHVRTRGKQSLVTQLYGTKDHLCVTGSAYQCASSTVPHQFATGDGREDPCSTVQSILHHQHPISECPSRKFSNWSCWECLSPPPKGKKASLQPYYLSGLSHCL